ncbi:Glycosyltransferase [Melia azedarach]|uniref:Glycosyltransferase n=1 Tax=Melia azedarach TaxID=155640 RepID=A0ACC1XYS0_MELAZ|nr:Glycosyltransferase [Melia azedarach]
MMALAIGLEESKKPFIRVVRPPIGFDLRGEFRSEWLPEGFEEGSNRKLTVVGEKLGTPVGDFVTQIDMSISKPLRMEFYNGMLESRRTTNWVADGSRTGF